MHVPVVYVTIISRTPNSPEYE